MKGAMDTSRDAYINYMHVAGLRPELHEFQETWNTGFHEGQEYQRKLMEREESRRSSTSQDEGT